MTAVDVVSALGGTVLNVTPTPTVPARTDPVTGRRLVPFTGTDDPDLGADEQLAAIEEDLRNDPRSLQVALGPSEVGHPCPRRIAYGLLRYPVLNVVSGWLAGIGRAVHEQVACAFRDVNARLRAATGEDRYLVEHPVSVATRNALQPVVAGHLDLFDVALGEVTDWKVVGKTTLDKVKRGKIEPGYLGQQLVYGKGLKDQGHTVRRLRLHFLPRNEPDLRKGARPHAWDVTDDQLDEGAGKVLERFDAIADGVEQLGPAVLLQLDPVEANCGWCPFYQRDAASPLAGCSGPQAVTDRADRQVARQLDGLIG